MNQKLFRYLQKRMYYKPTDEDLTKIENFVMEDKGLVDDEENARLQNGRIRDWFKDVTGLDEGLISIHMREIKKRLSESDKQAIEFVTWVTDNFEWYKSGTFVITCTIEDNPKKFTASKLLEQFKNKDK